MLTFTRRWRQFNEGDPVPDSFDHGTREALRASGAAREDGRQLVDCGAATCTATIERGATAADPIPFIPDNKMVKPERVKRKYTRRIQTA